jgi:hypothetical protein
MIFYGINNKCTSPSSAMPGLAVAQMFLLASPAENKRGKVKAALNIKEKYLLNRHKIEQLVKEVHLAESLLMGRTYELVFQVMLKKV